MIALFHTNEWKNFVKSNYQTNVVLAYLMIQRKG